MLRITGIVLACLLFTFPAQARQKTSAAHPDCNILWPCAGVGTSPRGERVVKAMHGFGAATKVYRREAKTDYRQIIRPRPRIAPVIEVAQRQAQIVSHPAGCPSRAFCGCGAAVRLLGAPIRALWLAANWFKFPRVTAAPDMAGVRPHHVIALIEQRRGNIWLVYDANSGGHATRIHEVDISRYTIVNPRV